MLRNPETSHGPDDNKRYLIAMDTSPGRPVHPCVRAPKERKSELQEVLADYERRKTKPRRLIRAFSVRKPYILLNTDEVRAFMGARSYTRRGAKTINEQYEGVTDLFTLSDVYFSRNGTLALTSTSTWCGGLCGLSQWKVFEKLPDGTWEERKWISCITIAKRLSPVLVPYGLRHTDNPGTAFTLRKAHRWTSAAVSGLGTPL
ncbi:MAG TPA: hypothetical protein VGE93_20745 [Bryobacteraceae bacterium]